MKKNIKKIIMMLFGLYVAFQVQAKPSQNLRITENKIEQLSIIEKVISSPEENLTTSQTK